MLVVANYAWPSRLLSYLRFIEARVSIVYFVDLDASGDPRMWSTAWSADQLYDLRLRPDAGVTALIFSSPRSADLDAALDEVPNLEFLRFKWFDAAAAPVLQASLSKVPKLRYLDFGRHDGSVEFPRDVCALLQNASNLEILAGRENRHLNVYNLRLLKSGPCPRLRRVDLDDESLYSGVPIEDLRSPFGMKPKEIAVRGGCSGILHW